jgi:predicted nucleic acid-binding protein
MRPVFADASYWIALNNTRDGLHEKAMSAGPRLGLEFRITTSQMVLVETLNSLSSLGPHGRLKAARNIQEIFYDSDVEVVPQTSALFHQALALYRARPDKAWSLTDCASFLIMDERQIAEALTYDQHFEQRGYRALLRD